MEFYRHTIHNQTEINDDLMSKSFNQLSSFGFCKRDGSELIYNAQIDGPSDQNPELLRFKWKFDSTNYVWFQNYYFGHTSSHTDYSFGLNGPVNFIQNFAHDYTTTIFIPLKNNNFIIQQYAPRNKNIITPPFLNSKKITNSELIPSGGSQWEEYTYSRTVLSFINNSNFTKQYCYLLLLGRCDTYHSVQNPALMPAFNLRSDIFQTSKGLCTLLNTEIIPPTDTSFKRADIIYHNYNNVNQGVCTLARIPCDDIFLDGLYLCTTYPCDQIEGKVFSFNGRNFLGVYENLVVELPAN